MATLAATAARKAASLTRISSPKTPIQAANLIQRRGLAGAAGNLYCYFVYIFSDPTFQLIRISQMLRIFSFVYYHY